MKSQIELFDKLGRRKYLTPEERAIFEETTKRLKKRESRLFCDTLLHTGGRISEVLELTPLRFDFSNKEIILRTLKKERSSFRSIPVPDRLLDNLDLFYNLEKIQKDSKLKNERLWKFTRKSAWERVKRVMKIAEFDMEAPYARPHGLRHGLGVHLATTGALLTDIQDILGHSSPEMTAVYVRKFGKEKKEVMSKTW